MVDVTLTWTEPATGDKPFYYEVDKIVSYAPITWGTIAKNLADATYTDKGNTAGLREIWRVRALGQGGYSDYTTLIYTPEEGTPPGAVTDLELTADLDVVDIEWGMPETGSPAKFTYDVERRVTGSETWTLIADKTPFISWFDTTVPTADTYWYRVTAYNENGAGPSTSKSVKTRIRIAPGPVTELVFALDGYDENIEVVATWSAPETGDDTDFTYNWERREVGETEWLSLHLDPITATSGTDRVNAGQWDYRVRAANNNQSRFGPWSTRRITAPTSIRPGGVRNLTLTVDGFEATAEITIDWNEPSTGRPAEFTYEIEAITVPAPPNTDPFSVTGLEATKYVYRPGASGVYSIRVRAHNVNPTPGAWITKRVTVPATPTAPGALTAMSVLQSGKFAEADVIISWSAPQTGTTPFVYDIERQPQGSAPNTPWTEVVSGTDKTVTTDIDPGIGKWTYRGRARNASPTPGPPTLRNITIAGPVEPGNVGVTLSQSGTGATADVTITITAPTTGDGPFEYDVERRVQGAAPNVPWSEVVSGTGATSIDDDNPGIGKWDYRARARGASPTPGNWTTKKIEIKAPVAAGALSAMTLSQTGTGATADVTISLGVPLTGTPPFTGDIERQPAGSAPNTPWTEIVSGLALNLRTLTTYEDDNPGIGDWTYRARARTVTPPPGSWTERDITIAAPVTAPSNPTSVAAASPSGSRTVTISWFHSPATDTSPATSFNVRRGTSTTFSTQTTTTVTGTQSKSSVGRWSVTNIPSAGSYYYWVQAENSGGTSGWVRTNRVTLANAPGIVRLVSVALYTIPNSGGTKGVNISWTPPSTGGAVATYDVYRSVSSTFSFETASSVTATSPAASGSRGRWFTNDALASPGRYYYFVRARNSGGASSWVRSSRITVPTPPPPVTPPPTCWITIAPSSAVFTGNVVATLRWGAAGSITSVDVRFTGGVFISNATSGTRGLRGSNPPSSTSTRWTATYAITVLGPGGRCSDSVTLTLTRTLEDGNWSVAEVVNGHETC